MTQIKKLGFGVVATALFAVLAMATMVSTVSAALVPAGVSVDDPQISVGQTTDINVQTNANNGVLITVLPSSTGAIQFEDGSTSSILRQVNDTTRAFEVEGVSNGVVVLRVEAVGAPASEAITLALTVGEPEDETRTLSLDGPNVIAATATGVTIEAALEDADGDDVPGATFDFTVVGAADNVDDSVAGEVTFDADGNVGQTITVVVVETTTGLTATKTVTIGQTGIASVAVSGGPIQAGTQGTFTVTVTGTNGNPVNDGPAVSASASAGVAFNCSNLKGGTSTCNFVAPSTPQTVTVVAAVGNRSGTGTISVTAAAPTQPGDGTLTAPNFGTGNVGSAVFNGGSIAQLAEAAQAAGGTAVWVQGTNGNWYRYSIGATGATAFVNNAFNTQFASGFAGATPVFVVR